MRDLKQVALAILMLTLISGQVSADTPGVDIYSNWKPQRNATVDSKAQTIKLKSNGYIFDRLDTPLQKHAVYRLAANMRVAGNGDAYFGLAFYDAGGRLMRVIKRPVDDGAFAMEFAIPSLSSYAAVYAKTDPNFSGEAEISQMSLKLVPAR